jgi:hypothetical protein
MAADDLDDQVWNTTGDKDLAKAHWKNDGDAGNPFSWRDAVKPEGEGDPNTTPPADVTPPTLTWVPEKWPLPATGNLTPSSGSEGGNSAAPVVADFAVDVGTLDDAQNALLPKSDLALKTYEALRASTAGKVDWIFQQPTAALGTESSQVGGSSAGGSGPTVSEVKVEANPELVKQTPKVKSALDNALLAIADSIKLTGDYAAHLNTAAQTYTYADKQAYIDPDGTPPGK